jgi:hypothetical protein
LVFIGDVIVSAATLGLLAAGLSAVFARLSG